jgi:hypothetical protein
MPDEEVAAQAAVSAEAAASAASSAASVAVNAEINATETLDRAEEIIGEAEAASVSATANAAETAVAAAEAGAALANAHAARTILEVEGDISWLRTRVTELTEAATISNDLLAQLGANLAEIQSRLEQSSPAPEVMEQPEELETVEVINPAVAVESPAAQEPGESRPKRRRLI